MLESSEKCLKTSYFFRGMCLIFSVNTFCDSWWEEFFPRTGPDQHQLTDFTVHSQDAPVVFLLIHLVDDVFDEDAEMFHGVVINDVAHV